MEWACLELRCRKECNQRLCVREMMNLTNYHSHCDFCDGKAPMEEFVKSALNAGFTAYGFSSHAPLPFSTRWTLKRENVGEYLKEFERLKRKYAGQIELYAGLEIDYLNAEQNPAMPYFQNLPLDYRIGSVHLVCTDEGEIVDTDTSIENFRCLLEQYFRGDLRKIVTLYYNSSIDMVERGGFDFVGHADKISHNAESCCPGVTSKDWYIALRNRFWDVVAEKGVTLEINTKAWMKRGAFFPDQSHWKEILKRRIPVVVNSDTHIPDMVNAGRREALLGLSAVGFRTVRELHAGKWEDVSINIID